MSKSITKNYIYNLFYEILAILIPIITTPYLSRILGAEKIGIYSYTISITTYFILFGSLGIAMYGKREIAYVQDDVKSRSKLFFEIFNLRLITLFFSMLVFFFTFCINGQYNIYYKILLFEIVANIFDISWYFHGLEEFKKTVIRNIIVKLFSAICIFAFVKTKVDLWKYLVIYVSSMLLGNLSLWLYLPRYIIKINVMELNIKQHIKPTIMLFIPQIATQVYTVLDKTMIGAIIIDKSEVGYYEQAQKIIKLLMTIATSLGTVMLPRIAATYAKGDTKKLKEYLYNSFSFVTLISFPLMFGIASISYHFVPIFFGNEYDKVISLLCIISPIILFIGLSNIIGNQYLLPTKRQKEFTLSVIVGAVINFILNIILINYWASIGASIATVIAELAVTVSQFVIVRKEISISSIFHLTYKYFCASIIMFGSSIIIGIIIKNDFISLITQVVLSVIIYFSSLFIMKDEFVINGLIELKKKYL